MATTKFLIGLVCAGIAGSTWKLERSVINVYPEPLRWQLDPLTEKRLALIKRAQNELGVREETGHNDGTRVEAYLKSVGLHTGDPYCAAFISYLFLMEGYQAPKTGWCPDLFPASRLAKSTLPGNVIGIYFIDKKRIAHVALMERVDGEWCISIEGNTNIAGSREGDGVYRKRRHCRTIYRMANWLSERRSK
jgi:hypothetical protein